jgi:hypothetical protein
MTSEGNTSPYQDGLRDSSQNRSQNDDSSAFSTEISAEIITDENQSNPFSADDLSKAIDHPIEPPSSLLDRVEAYLLTTYSWHLTPEEIDRDFRAVLNNSSASIQIHPYQLKGDWSEEIHCLKQIDRVYFVDTLLSRGVLTQQEIQTIADQLESIRLEKLFELETLRQQTIINTLRQRVEHYLIQTPKEQLCSGSTLAEVQSLFSEDALSFEELNQRLAPYSREEFRQVLVQRLTYRHDITDEEMGEILDHLEAARDRLLTTSRASEAASQDQTLQDQALQDQAFQDQTKSSERHPDEPNAELAANVQFDRTSVANQSGAYVWSTWEQAQWKRSDAPAPATGTPLSWTTWSDVRSQPAPPSNAPSSTTPLPSSQAPPSQPSATPLAWSTWEQLRSPERSDGLLADNSAVQPSETSTTAPNAIHLDETAIDQDQIEIKKPPSEAN